MRTAIRTSTLGGSSSVGYAPPTFTPAFDPNWWQRWQYKGTLPSVVMDWANSIFWNGTATLTVDTSLVSGTHTVTPGSGILCNNTTTTAAGALLSAYQGASGYATQIATFGAAAAAGANVGMLSDNNTNGIFMNNNSAGFLTFNNGLASGLQDNTELDWQLTCHGVISSHPSTIRRLSSMGPGATTVGATGFQTSDTNGYASPTAIDIGYWNGAFEFGGYISQLAVFNAVQLPAAIIPPPGFVAATGLWWDGDQNNFGIVYGDVLDYEYTQPWTAIAAVCLLGCPNSNHNGVSGLIFTNVTAGTPFTGYEMWVDGNGFLTVRIINTTLTSFIDLHGSTFLPDGKWHVVAGSYDGSGLAAGVKLYVDGVAETITILSDNLTGSIIASGQVYIVGNQQAQPYGFQGAIGLFRQYNVVKPQSFIANFQINMTLPPIDGTCVLAPKMTEGGTSTTTADASSSGLTGTLSADTYWLRI